MHNCKYDPKDLKPNLSNYEQKIYSIFSASSAKGSLAHWEFTNTKQIVIIPSGNFLYRQSLSLLRVTSTPVVSCVLLWVITSFTVAYQFRCSLSLYIPQNYNCEMVCYFGSQESVFCVSYELAVSNEWISCEITCSLHLRNSIDKSCENCFHKSGHAFNSIQLNSIQFKGVLFPEQEAHREHRPPHSIRFFKSLGNTPLPKDKLQIWVKGSVICSFTCFIIFGHISFPTLLHYLQVTYRIKDFNFRPCLLIFISMTCQHIFRICVVWVNLDNGSVQMLSEDYVICFDMLDSGNSLLRLITSVSSCMEIFFSIAPELVYAVLHNDRLCYFI